MVLHRPCVHFKRSIINDLRMQILVFERIDYAKKSPLILNLRLTFYNKCITLWFSREGNEPETDVTDKTERLGDRRLRACKKALVENESQYKCDESGELIANRPT